MRILLITHLYPSSSYPYLGVFVKNQVEALKKSGIEVLLSTVSFPSRKKSFVFLKYLLLFSRTLRLLFLPFDLVHVHYIYPPGLLGLMMKYLRRVPLVVTSHGGDINDMAERNPVNKFLTLLILKSSDFVIAVSEDIKEKIVNGYNIHPQKVRAINMGINSDIFKPLPIKKPEKPKTLLFVGRLEKVKGLDIILKSLLALPQGIHLQVVGEGKEKEEYENFVKKKGLKDRVKFLGALPQRKLPFLYNQAHLTVIPSREESFGLVGLESMSCGTPVLASFVGGLKEYIKDGVNGFLVPAEDSRSWSEKINKIFKIYSTPQWRNIKKRGEETAQKFSSFHQAEKVKDIYEILLNKSI
ncbi:glycosyltransferase [Candidatus Calescamantes bacterium]|nr:glycosyltransferase [Candidatus Calescamantes bacterium]